MTHRYETHVYYEDVDLAGIVYYANYLKYIERARTEYVRALGIDQTALKAEGVVFAVTRVEADYLQPARFDDALTVLTRPIRITPARIMLEQIVQRVEIPLFRGTVTLAALGPEGRATRLPEGLRRAV